MIGLHYAQSAVQYNAWHFEYAHRISVCAYLCSRQSPRCLRQPQLRRYLRQETTAVTHPASFSTVKPTRKSAKREKPWLSDGATSVYRSRHYNPSQVRETGLEKCLLEPHVLSARLKKLCEAGSVDTAVTYLKSAPLDAQNTPVWNTLIWECMKARRFQLAYRLFVDMKRRGFSPSSRTFQTMFSGLSRIEFWSAHPKQLANARSTYEYFKRHLHAIRKDDPLGPELCIDPLAGYIKILGDAGEYQEMFDVYNALDSEGPLAANRSIFTAMFQALSSRNSDTYTSDQRQVLLAQTASDAKLLWNQMLKASGKSPGFSVDSFIVSTAVTALSRGGAVHQTLAFQILRDYLGLTQPGEPPVTGTIPLAPQSLTAALMLCNNSQRYPLCIHLFQQVIDRPEKVGGVSIIDRAHVEQVLKAHVSVSSRDSAHHALQALEWTLQQAVIGRNGQKIRPAASTFNLVLVACCRGADWDSAARVFELMTGCHADDFKDGSVIGAPRSDRRSPGKSFVPDAETLSYMVRAALSSGDCANMRQCLHMIESLGVDQLLLTQKRVEASTINAVKYQESRHEKLATVLIATIDRVFAEGSQKAVSANQSTKWRELRFWAVEVLKKSTLHRSTDPEFVSTLRKRSTQRDSLIA